MSTIQPSYPATGQSITITLDSLASGSLRQSASVSNAANKDLDHLVQVQVKSGSSVSSMGSAMIYVTASVDAGTTFGGGATGSDGSYSGTKANLVPLGWMAVTADSTTYRSPAFSVAAAFGGTMPERYALVVENLSGATLASSGHAVTYSRHQITSA